MLFGTSLWRVGLYFLLAVPLSSSTRYYGSDEASYNGPSQSQWGKRSDSSLTPAQVRQHEGHSSRGYATVAVRPSSSTAKSQYSKSGTESRKPSLYPLPQGGQKDLPTSGSSYRENVPYKSPPTSWKVRPDSSKSYGPSVKAPKRGSTSAMSDRSMSSTHYRPAKPPAKASIGSGQYRPHGDKPAFGKSKESKRVYVRPHHSSAKLSSGSLGFPQPQLAKTEVSSPYGQRGSATSKSSHSQRPFKAVPQSQTEYRSGNIGYPSGYAMKNNGQNTGYSSSVLPQQEEEEDDDDDDDDSSLTTIPSALGKGIIMTISANKRQIKTGQGVPKFRPGPPPQTANPSYGSTGGYKRWGV
ncbi:uncharacterized protein LOC105903701 [Clupea harengus]|uniref:Uncharacterized protein LOC105903701 n=1 Tax=Clupea harengus TaxID=7950 RepID=A0A6P3W1G8_CLUHA|nr:uncharacterized protein LOC105903701 [Clupea harengus]